jgi:hypothetical protein
MVLMGYSGARGTLIYEKNLMSKISCQTPFKKRQIFKFGVIFNRLLRLKGKKQKGLYGTMKTKEIYLFQKTEKKVADYHFTFNLFQGANVFVFLSGLFSF